MLFSDTNIFRLGPEKMAQFLQMNSDVKTRYFISWSSHTNFFVRNNNFLAYLGNKISLPNLDNEFELSR